MDRVKFVEDTVRMLTEQGQYAVSDDGASCMYKTDTGLKCAIGLHIPDALYTPIMEAKDVQYVMRTWPEIKEHLESQYGLMWPGDVNFLRDCQTRLHDSRAGESNRPMLTLEEAKKVLFID